MNIGFRMGNGYCVVDVDPRNGGDESFRRLEAEHGPMPRTPKVITGGGGFHLYFKADGVKKGIVAPGIDLQGEGSQVVAPPSRHKSGKAYRWELAPEGIEAGVEQVPFAPLPEWVIALTATVPTKATAKDMPTAFTFTMPGDFHSEEAVPEGEAHKRLIEYAGRHLGWGEAEGAVLALALAWKARMECPMSENEVERQVRSLAKKEGHQAEQHPFPLTPGDKEGESWKGGIVEPSDQVTIPRFHDSTPPPQSEGQNYTFHLPPDEDEGERVVVASPRLSLHADAFHGLLGSTVKAIEPETEADPAAVLVSLLSAFGSAVGPGPHAQAGADRHGVNLFARLVGPTTARKGQSESVVKWIMERVDPAWAKSCIIHGLGSGEGLAERLQDERIEQDDKGKPVVKPGASDKRLLAIERECASVFKKARREGSSLSDMMRNAFDGKPLEVTNRKKNSIKATGHHVSVIGHITHEELSENLSKGTEAANGFLNRFLIVSCSRARKLPSGGNVSVLDPFVKPLAEALAFAREARIMKRSPEAEKEWASWYFDHAEHEGILGKIWNAPGKVDTGLTVIRIPHTPPG